MKLTEFSSDSVGIGSDSAPPSLSVRLTAVNCVVDDSVICTSWVASARPASSESLSGDDGAGCSRFLAACCHEVLIPSDLLL